jgi:hypothetical protein
MSDDDAPFMTEIRFLVSQEDADEFSKDLLTWLEHKNYLLEWKP